MFDDEEEEGGQGIFLLVLAVLLSILLVVAIVAISGDEVPEATVTGPAPPETTTTTTEPPEPTTTAAPTTTTTTIPTSDIAATMWEALNDSGKADVFTTLVGELGLQTDLEALEDKNGSVVDRTFFAPRSAAIDQLSPEDVSALLVDLAATNAIIGYHFLDDRYSLEDLRGLDGQTIESRTGQLMSFANDGDDVMINGLSRITEGDLEAENGVVHIIDTILEPPDTVNELIGLQNIEFEVGSATLTPVSEVELQKAVEFFEANPDFNASIEGHTDTDGGEEGNQALSQSRADAVKAFLVANGIDEDRLSTIGFGETDPILVDGLEDRAASRRIEFIVAN